MTPDDKQSVTCQANVSQFVHCSYKWSHKDGNVVNEFQGKILQSEDLKENGIYECLASCSIMNHPAEKCVLLSDRVKFSTMVKGNLFFFDYIEVVISIKFLNKISFNLGKSEAKNVLLIVLSVALFLIICISLVLLYVFVIMYVQTKFSNESFFQIP